MMKHRASQSNTSPAPLSMWLGALAVCLLCFSGGELTLANQAPDAPAPGAAEDVTEDVADDQGRRGSVVGWLELSGPLRDGPTPFAWVTEEEAGPSLPRVLRQMDHVAAQDHYLGIVIYLDQPELSLTQIHAIGEAMARIREAGKPVMTFAESYDMRDYLLASSADMVLLQHKGAVELSGLSIEEIYLGRLLTNIGVKADLLQVGQFKGADEPWTRQRPSEAWDRNMSELLDDLYEQMIDRIAAGRSLDREQMEAVIRDSWAMSDVDYLRRGVVDRLTDRDLVDVTEVEFGDRFIWDDVMGQREGRLQQVDNPFALFRILFQERRPTTRRDTVAVVHASGPITSGGSSHGDGLFSADSIGSRTLVRTFGEIRDDPHIQAVVLRIDSPGGSALASEVIWQSVRDLAEHKPVFASIDTMAASGGYYLASGADEIYVSPQSIVGSIGVVGGKFVLGDLYDKVGLDVHRRSRGPLADMFNSVEPFTDEQRVAMRSALDRIYEQFLDRVTIGRGNRLDDASAVAAGRLFTGRQAVSNGMADATGSLGDAIAAAASRAGLEEGRYDIVNLPPPMSLVDFLDGLFGVHAPGGVTGRQPAMMGLAQQLLGPEAWRSVQHVMEGMVLLRDEPVLTLMPYVIVVR